MSGKYEKEKKQTWLILLPSIGMAVCIAVTIWALFFRQPGIALAPDYAPQETERNAQPIPDDDSAQLDTLTGGGSITIEYDNHVTIDLSEGKAYLSYANPGKSTQDIVLRIQIQDTVVAQSGTIQPGSQVRVLALLEGAEKQLQTGVYTDAAFKILSYDPETGEKAMIDTVAEITVTVRN